MSIEKQIVLRELRKLSPRSPRTHEHDRAHVVRRPDYPPRRYPRWRNKYGQLVVNHQVTLEQELEEIRTRHAARREYNRVLSARAWAQYKAKRDAILSNDVDQSDD